MNAILLTLTLISGLSIQAQAAMQAPAQSDAYYECTPSKVNALYPLEWVKVRKGAEADQVITELSFKTPIASIVYSTDSKYIENPKFTFPSWNGSGVNFITEKQARDFKAPKFSGCINGTTDEFDFSANLECKLISAPVKTLAKK